MKIITQRGARKNQKKALMNALKQSFENAKSGNMAQINHEGEVFLLTKVKLPIQQTLHEGMPHMLVPMRANKDTVLFGEAHQKLHIAMQKLNYEQKSREEFLTNEQHKKHVEIMEKNEELFAQLDGLTFEFAEGLGKPVAQQRSLTSQLNDIIESNPVLKQLLSGKVEKTSE